MVHTALAPSDPTSSTGAKAPPKTPPKISAGGVGGGAGAGAGADAANNFAAPKSPAVVLSAEVDAYLYADAKLRVELSARLTRLVGQMLNVHHHDNVDHS